MTATFVRSPYVFFDVHAGDLLVRATPRGRGEKGTFYRQGNSLGVTTNVAGQRNNFLLTGKGRLPLKRSQRRDHGEECQGRRLAYLPEHNAGSEALARFFETRARNVIASVSSDYALAPSLRPSPSPTAIDSAGALVNTLAGLQPLHWKHSALR